MIPEIYIILSVLLISLISILGILFLLLKKNFLNKIIMFLVSLSAGSLLGSAFFHILPEVAKDGFTIKISLSVIGGILIFFAIENIIRWRHCHTPVSKKHLHPLAFINLIGDGIHNFLDGIIIAVSYLINIPLGISTTIAVISHEIPQEIGDFGVLIYSGLSKGKAIFYNFLSALLALIGAIIGILFTSDKLATIMLPFAAGGFIYIAGSDLIPEIQKKCGKKVPISNIIAIILGLLLMFIIKLILE